MSPSYLDSTPAHELTMARLLERRAAEDPDATFFSWADQTHAVGAFNSDVNRMARNLLRCGITEGTHVGVLMDTSPDYLTLWYALAKIGAVEVPINTAYHGDVLRHQLATGEVTVCVVDQKYAAAVAAVAPEVPDLKVMYVRGDQPPSVPVEVRGFAEFLTDAETSDLGVPIRHDAIGGIIFTSGTTGPSKGVLLTNYYIAAYAAMYADLNGLRDDDVLLNFLPFFHIGAKFLTNATLLCGGVMRLLPRLSISSFLDEVHAHGVTNFVGVGGVCNMLLSKPPREDDKHSPIRTIYAVPDPADIHEELERRFNCRITTVYGSTEVGLPIFRGVHDDYRPGSCGRLSPHYEVRVVDEFDNELPPGEVGELIVRPKRPFLTGSGYVGMPEKTIAAWRNLWLHSGDLGRIDEDGWFYFEDRATDSLRRRGENISSFEVETLVGKHPAVSEAVAVAGPSDLEEDEVRVLVTLREGRSLTPEELLKFCAETMPYFMVPRYIDIVTDFPRTPTAKVEKYKIRKMGLTSSTWDREKNGWTMTRNGLVRMTTEAVPAEYSREPG